MEKKNRPAFTLAQGAAHANMSAEPCQRATTLVESAAHTNISGITNDVMSAAGRPKAAFTLAEVLISLGIIGIVAAMTIPTLIQNYQERAWNKSAEVFERKLEAALQVMNTQEVLAGYNNTKDFVTELGNHFKITKICDTPTDCFEDTVYWDVIDISKGTSVSDEVDVSTISTASDLGQSDWNTEAIGVQFGNGVSAIVAYNPDCTQDPYSNQITGTSCLAMAYDTTGYKTPNTYGKDLRSINAVLEKCAFKSGSVCFGTPFLPTALSYSECMEVKDDLGLNYCYNGKDYYAGAVQACGGIQNLPTSSQLTELANYLYNTEVVSSGHTYNVTLDTDKMSGFGLSIYSLSNPFFCLWSNQEISDRLAYYRVFYTTHTYWIGTSYRSYGYGYYAVCLKK